VDRLAFSFPDVDGNLQTYPDATPRRQGRVDHGRRELVPELHDEALFLKELLASRGARGLEVIQLMFERTLDFASSAKAARDFVDKFSIDYPVLIAGTVTTTTC
jgi:hypothetical protein